MLPTGYACTLTSPPRGAIAVALQALTLLVNHRLALERGEYLIEYFKSHPCVDCGETDPVVLEFDHLGKKSFTVADGMKDKSWTAVLREIEKCEVVCVNCHRRRTAYRGGFRRLGIGAEPLATPRLFGPWT